MSHCAGKTSFGHPDEPTRIRLEMWRQWMLLGAIENICNRFTLSRRQRSNVNERLYPLILRARDDSARIGMSHQDCRPVGSLQDALESGYVIRKRCEGDRRARYQKTFSSQRQNDVVPARTISPRAVDQYDCAHCDTPLAARNSFIAAA